MGLTQATLCLISQDGKILLGMKRKDLFGGGKYNGPGGKVNPGETLEQAAVRELREESGLKAQLEDIEKVGEFSFYFPEGQEKYNQTVHVYQVSKWHGELGNSDEMIWNWFSHQAIPYHQMWDSDKHFLPLILQGKRLKGTFYFNEDRKVKEKDLREVDSL
jgi:8-oxo-dGTP diphosphatase